MTNVNLSSARMYHAETFGAKLQGLNIQNAQVYESGIAVGGGE
jgi:uncharacterized protein YjbI with pentapeptide repeats